MTAELGTGTTELAGREAVFACINGQQPYTAVYALGGWSEPVAAGDGFVVEAEFPALGNGPFAATVNFEFNERDQIQSVREVQQLNPRPQVVTEMPLASRGLITNAFANHTPMVVAYVNEKGEAELSLRGSTAVYSPTQICVWLRDADGGLSRALRTNPNISLLYRDSWTRSSLIIKGKGHIENDVAVRRRVYELAPESEQTHDPRRVGAALIVDVTQMRGGTPKGGVNVQPQR